MVRKIYRRNNNLIFTLSVIAIIFVVFLMISVNFEEITKWLEQQDTTIQYTGEVTDKDEDFWVTYILIPNGDGGITTIPQFHYDYDIKLNNTLWVDVSGSNYRKVDIGDQIIIYLSGRIEIV